MRSPIRRPGFLPGLPPRRRSTASPPVTLLALLKHPLLRLGEPRARRGRAGARGPARSAAARRQRRPCARADAIFARQLDKFRRGEPVDLHPSDPRTELTDSELAAAADLVARLAAALEPLESIGSEVASAQRIRRAPSRRALLRCRSRTAMAAALRRAATARKLADALDELATSEAAAGLARRDIGLCRTVFRGACRPRGAAASRSLECACASSARSKRA